MTNNKTRDFLCDIGQEHLYAHLSKLPEPDQALLLQRLKEVHWDELKNIFSPPDLDSVSSAEIITLLDRHTLGPAVENLGAEAYRRGEVGVLMVAGGDGTRLGHPGPKGTYPLGAISGKSIYQLQADRVRSLSLQTAHDVPLLIQTSPSTNEATSSFLLSYQDFGLNKNQRRSFVQGTVPTTDEQGRCLLAACNKLLENPNGHGGVIEALAESGILDTLLKAGIRDLVYVQVDNVLVPIMDPFAVGLRRLKNLDVVTKVLKKTEPDEKVGALVRVAGRDAIVEYTDLTPEQKRVTNKEGELLFGWGMPSMYIFSVEFLSRLCKKGFKLPYHLSAPKKVKVWDGERMTEVTAIKRERFVFDILPEARNIGLEVVRDREFAPVKNPTGVDSAESARRMLSNEFSRWLGLAGTEVKLSAGEHVEISPLFASHEAEFVAKWNALPNRPKTIEGNTLIS